MSPVGCGQVAAPAGRRPIASTALPARVALLGTGTVGRALLARLCVWRGTPFGERLCLAYVGNSRTALRPVPGGIGWKGEPDRAFAHAIDELAQTGDIDPRHALRYGATASLRDAVSALGDRGPRIVIDATASDAVAERHATWLAQGIHVITACKLGQGASLTRWRAIREASVLGGTRYGDAATVGAGLPLLRTIRALRAGGDRIHRIAGVLSGSLAWLFHHYDGLRSFSGFVRQAREAGYTEPDPRDDLSGEDVRRKLLILARTAGYELERDAVEVESLIPPALLALCAGDVDVALQELDAPMRERFADAYKRGEKLRYVANLDADGARIGLESLPADHPLAVGHGTDNRVAIWSDRYCDQPLVIQGPGAGADVTAAALLDDALGVVATPPV